MGKVHQTNRQGTHQQGALAEAHRSLQWAKCTKQTNKAPIIRVQQHRHTSNEVMTGAHPQGIQRFAPDILLNVLLAAEARLLVRAGFAVFRGRASPCAIPLLWHAFPVLPCAVLIACAAAEFRVTPVWLSSLFHIPLITIVVLLFQMLPAEASIANTASLLSLQGYSDW